MVQHAEGEGPGILADVLASAGQSVTDVHLHRGDALPHPGSFDAVVAMGGPMGANDEARYPWLGPERRWLADAVRDGRPVLGVCLGAQLLASALGARVWAGDAPELGLDEVVLSAEGRRDAVLGPEGELLAVVQWHGDTFDLPPGAVHLASSERYAAQAFRFGDLAYGLQFHLEVDAPLLDGWRRDAPPGFDLDEAGRRRVEAVGRRVFGRFVTAACRSRRPAAGRAGVSSR